MEAVNDSMLWKRIVRVDWNEALVFLGNDSL